MLPASWSLRPICTIALLALSVPLLYGQAHTVQAPDPLVVEGLGKGAVLLDGPWQFHLGDETAWANPAFDDSHWEQLTADKPWGQQGHFAYTGFAWYRCTIDVSLAPGAPPDLAIYVPQIDTAYEIFWNGRLIGHRGKLPPHPAWLVPDSQTFAMGTALRGVLAVRAWKAVLDSTDSGMGGGFTAPMLIGNPQTLAALKAQDDYQWVRATTLFVVLYSLFGLLGLIGFGMWLRDRSQSLLLWAASYFASIYAEVVLGNGFLPWPGHIAHSLEGLCNVAVNISLWYLTCWLLDLRGNPRLMRFTRIAAFVLIGAGILHALDFWFLYRSEYELTAQICDAILTAVIIPLALWNLVPVAVAVLSHRKLELSRWLFACFTTFSSTFYMVYVASAQGARFTHWTLAQTLWGPIFQVMGSEVNIQTIADSCVLVSLVYAIYRYISENRKRQVALEQEHRNARAVQQVLIPDAIPSIPGFSIESIYKPAGEVGGDFFQILATPDGGVLVVIGDVSGKGMPAAMTVSLLVGTVRTLAHFTQCPAEILAAMNQRMLARSSGGFTTCLVLRADPDGLLTIANAGHIAPYLAGQELALENGLPLGLSAESTYPESTFQLAPEAQLTLLTDGVVEARNQSGGLFGFDRTQAISTESAEKVAQAAQAFGQDDDITVLTLSLMPQQKEVAA